MQSSCKPHNRRRLTRKCLPCRKQETRCNNQPCQIACIRAGLPSMQPATQRQARATQEQTRRNGSMQRKTSEGKTRKNGPYRPCKAGQCPARTHAYSVYTRPFQTFSRRSTMQASGRPDCSQASRDDPSPQNMGGWRGVFVKFSLNNRGQKIEQQFLKFSFCHIEFCGKFFGWAEKVFRFCPCNVQTKPAIWTISTLFGFVHVHVGFVLFWVSPTKR